MTMDSVSTNCWCGVLSSLLCFVAGAVSVVVAEYFLVVYFLGRLLTVRFTSPFVISASDLKTESEEDFSISLQGNAWVAPVPENVDLSKVIVKQIRKDNKKEKDSSQKDGSTRRDVTEIAPQRKHAVLKEKTLFLNAPDGTVEEVSLEGCEILTVTSSPEKGAIGESRKWGKKFPIKLRHPDHPLYRDCKTLLFYAQSGYAKEAWCLAFRGMAGTDNRLSKWTFETKRKYREYTCAAEENMPYLTKFYGVDETKLVEVEQKGETKGISKTRMMWKKLARKASIGRDSKETKFSQALDEVHRRKQPRHSIVHNNKALKNKAIAFDDEERVDVAESATPAVDPNFDRDTSFENMASDEAAAPANNANNTAPARMRKDNREPGDQVPAAPQKARRPKDERTGKEIEQGVLCLNMVLARLYYDFNQSKPRLASVERFFQRLLSKIRKPSYMNSITIKELDLGRHPPFATAIRMLPPDAEGTLAMELDLEWLGGGHLTCETRLDLRDQSTQEKVAAQLAESGSEGDVTAAVLSGLRGVFDEDSSASFAAARKEGRQQANLPHKKGRWMQSMKSMMSRVAEQVFQVPLALKIRLVSLRGTAVFKLKAPPSDRVWFAFKTMPDIHFEPEPCIGEHKISSSALARLIANQIKIQIRESVVLPYCEDFLFSWMLADKDNWLPRSSFPFPFFDSLSAASEHQTSQQMVETNSSSSDESVRPRHQPQNTTRALQNKPPRSQAYRNTLRSPFKFQKHQQDSHTMDAHDRLQPRRSSSDELLHRFSATKPPRSASSVHLSAQSSAPKPPRAGGAAYLSGLLSDPVQASGSTALSLMSSLSRNDLRTPLLTYDEGQNDEGLESARDLNFETSRQGVDIRFRDGSSHSEGSASESDLQFLATEVANPEAFNEPEHSSKISRRARVSSIGKKMLGEVRHSVAEKLHSKRLDDVDGSV